MSIPDTANAVIGFFSHIADLFGQSAGIRIGGTTVSAVLILAAAKLIETRAPFWVRWALYLCGGTMAVGGTADILQKLIGG